MSPQTLLTIEVALKDRPGDWAERIAQALLDGGLTAASPEELAPIVAEEFGELEPESDYDEFEWAAEAALYRSPVIADRAAVALTGKGGYEYPPDEDRVLIRWLGDEQEAMTIYADGSALVGSGEPWASWEDALVRIIEDAIESDAQLTTKVEVAWASAEARIMAAQARELAERYGATVVD
jgi:hypothetical protein